MDYRVTERGQLRRKSRPAFWFGLMIVGLAASLFPAEAATPCLTSDDVAEATSIRSTCAEDFAANTWGTCSVGGDCCGGRREAECDRGVY